MKGVPDTLDITKEHLSISSDKFNDPCGCAIHTALVECFPDEGQYFTAVFPSEIQIGLGAYKCSRELEQWQTNSLKQQGRYLRPAITLRFNHRNRTVSIQRMQFNDT